jgi:hypothetical protein
MPEQHNRLRKQVERLRERSRELREHAPDNASKLKPELHKIWNEQKLAARKAHARVTRLALKHRWGETLRLKEAQDELRSHARRMARLHRIAALARELGKDEIAARASSAISKEQQRHQQQMEQLRDRLEKPSAAAATQESNAAGAPVARPAAIEGAGGAKAEVEQ